MEAFEQQQQTEGLLEQDKPSITSRRAFLTLGGSSQCSDMGSRFIVSSPAIHRPGRVSG
ncbi:MAG TPA: hypothetical protein VKY19_20600 [Ktedonosporobacter sp.]|nr:hypothetical protein [Ktedonosporobacter sp.]